MWSRAVATSGNWWQMRRGRNGADARKTVAAGCDRLHGKGALPPRKGGVGFLAPREAPDDELGAALEEVAPSSSAASTGASPTLAPRRDYETCRRHMRPFLTAPPAAVAEGRGVDQLDLRLGVHDGLGERVCSHERQQTMEPLWSPAVAIRGNRWQMGRPAKSLRQAKTVAVGCDRLRPGPHGKRPPKKGRGLPGSAKSAESC